MNDTTTNTADRWVLKLWLPFFVYSFIECALKFGARHFFADTFGPHFIIESLAYLLRLAYEVTLLGMMVIISQGGKIVLSDLWKFPHITLFKALISRLAILFAILVPILLITELFASHGDVMANATISFRKVAYYFCGVVWVYGSVYFLVRWWLHIYPIVFDGNGPISGLNSSYVLTAHHWWSNATLIALTIVHGIVRIAVFAAVITVIICFYKLVAHGELQHFLATFTRGQFNKFELFQSAAIVPLKLFKAWALGFPLQAYVALGLANRYFELKKLRAPGIISEVLVKV